MPCVAVVVEVVHGGLEGRLERMRMILKQPEHDSPHQCGKQRERVFLGLRDEAFFHAQSRQSKENPGQQVHIYLGEQTKMTEIKKEITVLIKMKYHLSIIRII